jgi:hypothetical protein
MSLRTPPLVVVIDVYCWDLAQRFDGARNRLVCQRGRIGDRNEVVDDARLVCSTGTFEVISLLRRQIAIGIAPPFAARVVVILLAEQEWFTPRLAPPLRTRATRRSRRRSAIAMPSNPATGVMRAPGERKRTCPFGSGRGGVGWIIWEIGAAREGLIAARTISTIADYATTGVSCQEIVRVLFSRIECPRCGRAGSYRREGLLARFGADAALPDVLMATAERTFLAHAARGSRIWPQVDMVARAYLPPHLCRLVPAP